MKIEILNKIEELSYEDALEVRVELNKHIKEKELKIKELLFYESLNNPKCSLVEDSYPENVLNCIGDMMKDKNDIELVGVKFKKNHDSYKCSICGGALISIGTDYEDEFASEMTETFKCENDLCEEIHERTISRDPNSDEQDVPILRTKKRRYL